MLIISGTRYQISHCTYCECDKATEKISCHKKNLEGAVQTLCENCTSLPADVSCSYCEKPGNKSVRVKAGNPIDIGEGLECVSCNCSLKGDVACFYYNHTICDTTSSCHIALSEQKMEQLSCSNGCIDPSSGLLRPEGAWTTKEMIQCSCMKSMASCFHMTQLGGFTFMTICPPLQCTPEKYDDLFVSGKGI